MNDRYLTKYNRAVINMRKHPIRSRKFRKWLNLSKYYWKLAISEREIQHKAIYG